MISATNPQNEVSRQLLGRAEPDWARGRADAGTFRGTNAGRFHKTDNRGQASASNESAEVPTAAAGLDGLRGRHRVDTPAALLESMIMQMGGGPYSTYKGMHVDLAV